MNNNAKICEIFKSIQGEGKYIGYEQIFVRFSGCNLKCKYCDTDFLSGEIYSFKELKNKIKELNTKNIHSISLTGGEPLLWSNFLLQFLPSINHRIYLETNATLPEELEKIINYIDYISADIKLNSCSQNGNLFDLHNKFFSVTKKYNKDTFIKIVFDENILKEEIEETVKIAKKNNYEIILQPKMNGYDIANSKMIIIDIYNKFKYLYKNVRLIPQTHKFLDIQ